MDADLELEGAPRWPADHLRRLVGKKDMGNEAEQQPHDPDAYDEGVEQQDVYDPELCARLPTEEKMYEGEQHAQDADGQTDQWDLPD